MIARATYSSTIARPGFNQSNVALAVDLGSGLVTQGNPNPIASLIAPGHADQAI